MKRAPQHAQPVEATKSRRVTAVYCYGPTHGSEEIVSGERRWKGKEFVFPGGVYADDLVRQGWRDGRVWWCPSCAVARDEAVKRKRQQEVTGG